MATAFALTITKGFKKIYKTYLPFVIIVSSYFMLGMILIDINLLPSKYTHNSVESEFLLPV